MAQPPAVPQEHGSEKLLECPICYNIFDAIIFMCQKGHNICAKCKPNIEVCPVCRQGYNGTRNFALEQLVSRGMTYSCENEKYGCQKKLPLGEMRVHQHNCAHRLYNCFVPSCRWTGRYEELKRHITGEHSNCVATSNDILLCDRMFSSTKVGHSDYIFVELDDELFVHFYKREPEKNILFSGHYIGDPEKASKYRFKLKFQNEHGSKKMVVRCAMQPDSQMPMTEENCFTLHPATAKQFQRFNGSLQHFFSIEKGK